MVNHLTWAVDLWDNRKTATYEERNVPIGGKTFDAYGRLSDDPSFGSSVPQRMINFDEDDTDIYISYANESEIGVILKYSKE